MSENLIHIDNYVFRKECPLCGSNKIKKVGLLQYISPLFFSSFSIILHKKPELWKCSNCYSKFTNNIIPQDIASSLYTESSGKLRWSGIPFIEDKDEIVIQGIKSIFEESNIKTILDIGCSTGEFLDFAKKHQISTFGVEYNSIARDTCKNKGHGIYASIEETSGKFDAITCFDLFEHLYQPQSFLNILEKKLNNNGFLVIHTGNPNCILSKMLGAKWWYASYPEHILFPSIKSFIDLKYFKLAKILKCCSGRLLNKGYRSKINIISNILMGRYNGFPPICLDHMLIILRKI